MEKLSGPKRTEASTSTEGQEELVTSTDNSSDSSDEDYDDGSYDDEDEVTTTTTTTTTGTQESTNHSPRDSEVLDKQKEQTLKSDYSDSIVVEDLPRDEPITLDQLTEQVNLLSHHLEEPLPPPPPPPNDNGDQSVDLSENPDLENEQSLLSMLNNKATSPVPILETDQSLLVENKTTSPMPDKDNEGITIEKNDLMSSIDDKIIEEVLASEYKSDELPTNETTIDAVVTYESKDLQNKESVHVETDDIITEMETNTKSEFLGFIEEHYSKEVCVNMQFSNNYCQHEYFVLFAKLNTYPLILYKSCC